MSPDPQSDTPAARNGHGPLGQPSAPGPARERPAREQPHADEAGARNVLGGPLATCGTEPVTGFYRDGCCHTGPDDLGSHVVCAEVTAEFLAFTASRGNDLATPRPAMGFAGLSPGDRWCLCASRWEEARRAGVAPPVVLAACHERALELVDLAHLRAHALDARS